MTAAPTGTTGATGTTADTTAAATAGGAAPAHEYRDTQIAVTFFAAVFFLFALCVPRVTTFLNPVTGDEPFYLVTAKSILADGDIDELNNFARRDWLAFYPAFPLAQGWEGWPAISPDLPPHASKTLRTGLYSKHGLGVPVLLLAPFALGGRTGVVLLYVAMGAGVAANLYLLARTVAGRGRSLATAGILTGSVPLFPYSFLIFPEIPAALMILYATRRLFAPRNAAWQWLLVGVCAGWLPWLHARFIPVVASLALLFLWRHGWRALRRGAAWALLPASLSLVAFEAYSLVFYRFPLPNTQDHAGFSPPLGILNGFVGSLLDAQWGLFVAAPVYLLAAVALALFAGRRRRDGLGLLLILAPYGLVISTYAVWWGEWGPAARYWTPVLPLLALPLAWWWERAAVRHALGASVLVALASGWGFLFSIGWLRQPQWLYNQPDGLNNYLVSGLGAWGEQVAAALPAFQFYAASPVQVRAVWGICTLLIAVAAGCQMALFALPLADEPTAKEAPGAG